MLLSPARWGADIVVHSLTKFISGASDIVAGARPVARVAAHLRRPSWSAHAGCAQHAPARTGLPTGLAAARRPGALQQRRALSAAEPRSWPPSMSPGLTRRQGAEHSQGQAPVPADSVRVRRSSAPNPHLKPNRRAADARRDAPGCRRRAWQHRVCQVAHGPAPGRRDAAGADHGPQGRV